MEPTLESRGIFQGPSTIPINLVLPQQTSIPRTPPYIPPISMHKSAISWLDSSGIVTALHVQPLHLPVLVSLRSPTAGPAAVVLKDCLRMTRVASTVALVKLIVEIAVLWFAWIVEPLCARRVGRAARKGIPEVGHVRGILMEIV